MKSFCYLFVIIAGMAGGCLAQAEESWAKGKSNDDLMQEAYGYVRDGRFDLAQRRAIKVMSLDPENRSAPKLIRLLQEVRDTWKALEVASAHSVEENPLLLFSNEYDTAQTPMSVRRYYAKACSELQEECQKFLKANSSPGI